MTLKNGFGIKTVRYLFYQPMDEKIKTWPLRFPAKENSNMETALFDWPIVLQYDVKAKYRLISRKFFGHEVFFNHPKATRVCIRSINQSNRFTSVRLLFLFCSRVFISRSYENRSINSSIQTSLTQHWTNFRPVEKLDRTLRSFSRCSKHLNARNFQSIHCRVNVA